MAIQSSNKVASVFINTPLGNITVREGHKYYDSLKELADAGKTISLSATSLVAWDPDADNSEDVTKVEGFAVL